MCSLIQSLVVISQAFVFDDIRVSHSNSACHPLCLNDWGDFKWWLNPSWPFVKTCFRRRILFYSPQTAKKSNNKNKICLCICWCWARHWGTLGKVSFNSLMQINELFSSRKQSNIFLQISHPYTNFPFCRILSVFVSRIFQ